MIKPDKMKRVIHKVYTLECQKSFWNCIVLKKKTLRLKYVPFQIF